MATSNAPPGQPKVAGQLDETGDEWNGSRGLQDDAYDPTSYERHTASQPETANPIAAATGDSGARTARRRQGEERVFGVLYCHVNGSIRLSHTI